MPPVEIEIRLSKYIVDMLEAFALRDRRIVLQSKGARLKLMVRK